jgi:hypothetical protein
MNEHDCNCNPDAAMDAEQINGLRCIACDEPLHTAEQHWTHKPEPTVMVDCRNRDCSLYMVTASQQSYAETVRAFLAMPPAAVSNA